MLHLESSLFFFDPSLKQSSWTTTDVAGNVTPGTTSSWSAADATGPAPNWSHVVPGNFSDNKFSDILLYDAKAGAARFYTADGQGKLTLLNNVTGWQKGWSLIIPGNFSSGKSDDLLCWDLERSVGQFYTTDGLGNVTALKTTSGGNRTWSIIIAGHFSPERPRRDYYNPELNELLFYDRSNGVLSFFSTDGHGNLTLLSEHSDVPKTWTQVVRVPHPGARDNLLCYDGSTGVAELWRYDSAAGAVTRRIFGQYSQFGRSATLQIIASQDDRRNPVLVCYDPAVGSCSLYNQGIYTAPQPVTPLAALPHAAGALVGFFPRIKPIWWLRTLERFDHVVVLMLENRSFDNLLGYMYPDGVPSQAPLGKTFEGLHGKDLSNRVPSDAVNRPPPNVSAIPVSPNEPAGGLAANYFQPYPDPGEDYAHVNTQLFGLIDRANKNSHNLPPEKPLPLPAMQGFIADYIENYKTVEVPGKDPSYDDYRQIMQCFTPAQVPVITKLAEEFGVFDHWFCAVPSQTWCNRAFWNAGTSYGFVNNPPDQHTDPRWAEWLSWSGTKTLFNQLSDSKLYPPGRDWKVYAAGLEASLTHMIHFGALNGYWLEDVWKTVNDPTHQGHFVGDSIGQDLHEFFADCAAGTLPAYSFIEPRFLSPNNDMHPASAVDQIFGKGKVGSVLLGEKLIWDVYEAVRKSPAADKTLLIITFDEHGGCYDHVPPPDMGHATVNGQTVDTNFSNISAFGFSFTLENDFDFARPGVRVPTIMVSSHIAKNTVVNTPMDHSSFQKTMARKWNQLSPNGFPWTNGRVDHANEFSEVFTSEALRPSTTWPVLPEPQIPAGQTTRDCGDDPVGKVSRSIIDSLAATPEVVAARATGAVPDPATVTTVAEATEYFMKVRAALAASPATRT